MSGDVRAVNLDRRWAHLSGLVVCGGDFSAGSAVAVNDAVVLAAGDVDLGAAPYRTLVVAGGDIRFGSPVVEGDARDRLQKTVIRAREPKLAEFLKFYDSAAEGLHVRAEDGSVFVTKVDDGKPFAAAGIKPGDRIVRVDGKVVRSVRELNRLLCRAEVGPSGTAAVSLARGEKGVDAAVKLADPPKLDP